MSTPTARTSFREKQIDPAELSVSARSVLGLTHPGRYLKAATPLYKRRGALTAAVKSNWVERNFVLTDVALFWFDQSESLILTQLPIGAQQGRVDIRHIVSITPSETPGARQRCLGAHACAYG